MTRGHIALLLVGLAAASPAGAIDRPQPGDTICFGRIYAEAHLQDNPQQVARSLVVELTQWAETEDLGFGVNLVLVDDPQHTWWSSGVCAKDGQDLHCRVDCDGGSFRLADAKDGGLLLRNDAGGFVLRNSCGEELAEQPSLGHLPADAANAVYKLVRLPDAFCPDYE